MHKFKAGDRVLYRPASPWERGSSAEVIRTLPYDGPQPFYRVRSDAEAFERVVGEDRLKPLGTAEMMGRPEAQGAPARLPT